MAYETFALKYRPRDFNEIIAQDHVAVTLKNAVAEGRVAHGYLFAGPRGTGKTSTARVLAKALNCEHGPTPEPCGVCSMCTAIAAGRALDVIERDAASERGIDRMRQLLDRVPFAPAEGRCKVYILDEAHMLTPEASNALLKTLEEPPPFCYFVLATTELHKILPTIRSRCQVFEFRPIPLRSIMDALAAIAAREGIQIDEPALAAVAQAASGSMRDAQSIFDQVVAYQPGAITLEVVNRVLGVTDVAMLRRIMEAIAAGDIPACFGAVDDVVSGGKDIAQLLSDLALYCRDLLRLSLGAQPPLWSLTPDVEREGMTELARRLGADSLTEMTKRLGQAAAELRETSQHALLLELTLADLATMTAAEGSVPGSAALAVGSSPVAAPAAPTSAPLPSAPPAAAAGVSDAAAASGETAAPAAAAAPRVPPLPAETELTVADFQQRWPAVLQLLHETGHASVLALLADATPTAIEGDTLIVTFPRDREYHRNRAEQAYAGLIAEAVTRVTGRPVQLVMRLAEGNNTAAPAAPVAPAAEMAAPMVAATSAEQQEKLVQSALEMFPGSTELSDD